MTCKITALFLDLAILATCQMRMVPALCEMKLAAGRRCQRPLLLTATMKLPEKAEVS